MHNAFKKPFLIFNFIFICLGLGLCLLIYLILGNHPLVFSVLKIVFIFLLIYILMIYSLLLFISTKLDSILDTIHKQPTSSHQILPHEQPSLKVFASDLFAEAQSPLTNLSTYYSALLETPLTHEDHAKLLIQSKYQLNKLEWLFTASIKVADVESDCSSLELNNYSLKQLLTSAMSTIYTDSLDKNIEIQLDLIQDTLIYCDKYWTLKALYYLLDNAVKYSFTNTIIHIAVKESAHFIQVSITNQGIPINPDEIDLIFNRFYRNPEVHQIEGFGIGLYLSRLILEKQNSSIKVLFSQDTTTFLVFLNPERASV